MAFEHESTQRKELLEALLNRLVSEDFVPRWL